LSELVAQLHEEFGEHHYGRVDLELKAGQKERAIEHFSAEKMSRLLEWDVERRENLDGIKLYLGETGWLMLRASGTEPMLRVYSETESASDTKKVLEHACAVVRGL
jgi:phosphomannomutase